MKTRENGKEQTVQIGKEGYILGMEMLTEYKNNTVAIDEVPGGLTEDHRKVVECMRHYYLQMGTVPPVRMLSRRTGLSLRDMQRLFPGGLSEAACKIAGIPGEVIKPGFLYP